VETGRAQARKDAEAAIAAAESALRVAENQLRLAPVTRSSRADLEIFEADLTTLQPSLDAARQSFDGGDFEKSLEEATSVQERAAAIALQVEEALSRQAPPEK
jgi:hypothetical protein